MEIIVMPGISLACNLDGKKHRMEKRDNSDTSFSQALSSLIHDNRYYAEILLHEDHYLLGCTRYGGYPIKVIENDDFWICIEGVIYAYNSTTDYSRVHCEINDVIENVFLIGRQAPAESATIKVPTEINLATKVAEWLLKTDGDFMISAYNKSTGDLVILNDALGRLPFYYYKDDIEKKLIASRELQFILNLLRETKSVDCIRKNSNSSNIRFDDMAMAQYLLFGYPLGRRTLFSDISRLEPGTVITISNNTSEIKMYNINRFNFEKKKYGNDTIEINTSKLVSLFDEACRNRAAYSDGNKKNIVSLSGGFDSRAVASCLHKNKIPFSAATYLEPNKTNTSDVKIAKQLANIFGIDWNNYHLGSPKARDLLTLLKIKSGLNYLGASFIVPFLDTIKEQHDRIDVNFFTGEGGDRLLPNLLPGKKFKDMNDLIDHIISRQGTFSLTDVTSFLLIDKNRFVDEIRNILSSYPEKSLGQKYVHFLIYGRVFNWFFEGEDRDRFYFWSVAPFYSVPFFYYAMNCSDKNKVHRALQKRFLFALSPSAARINHTLFRYPITTKRFKISYHTIMFLINHVRLRKALVKLMRKTRYGNAYRSNSNIIECLREQITKCGYICRHFSCSGLKNIVDNPTNYSKFGVDNLFTLTTVIDETCCGTKTIQKYYK
jgi:asparagine synthase (glutamine-hydrolysing)